MQNHTEVPETLEDIIFRNRNKSYGAYSLRTDYQQVINRALLIGIGLFCLAILTPMIWAKVDDDKKIICELTPIDPNIPEPPKETVVPPIEKPPVQPEPQMPVAVQRFLPPEIVPNEQETELLKDQDELSKSDIQIGSEDKEGSNEPVPTDDPDAGKGSQPAPPVEIKVEDNQLYISVEQMPEYAGGLAALSKFLQKNLRYPNAASNVGVSGKVYVQFVVGQDGAISKVDILKGLGFGCDEEAQRVIKLMPHWSAGKQSGRAVAVKFTLPINFQLE